VTTVEQNPIANSPQCLTFLLNWLLVQDDQWLTA